MPSGGKRKGAGRKRLADPKKQIAFYINRSRIEVIGEDQCKDIGKEAIEFEYQRLKP